MDADSVDPLGRLAVQQRLLTPEQLEGALLVQRRRPSVPLSKVLCDLGLLTEDQVAQLTRGQGRRAERPLRQRRPRNGLGEVPAPGQRGVAVPPPVPPGLTAPAAKPEAPPDAPARLNGPAAAAGDDREGWLRRVLCHAVASHATDVHLHAGYPVMLRVRGVLSPMRKDVFRPEHARATLWRCLDEVQRQALERDGHVELAYEVARVGRFRASVYEQQGGLCGVFHYLPQDPPSLDALGLPETLARLCDHRSGLVLISGPSGSGKTTTMAALVARMNEERDDHILCLEDPIEYRHVSKRCVVNQREIGVHAVTYQAALVSALREDPDVICVGELRDRATMSLALSAAETGHLVIGTLHTQDAVRTVNRVVGAYPAVQQAQVRAMLAESLRGVISQRLVPGADGESLRLAYELLVVNQAAANLIRDNRAYQLGSVLQTGRGQGMQALDESLMGLVRSGRVTKKVASAYADSPAAFKGALAGASQ